MAEEPAPYRLKDILDYLESCNYQSSEGPLHENPAFKQLLEAAEAEHILANLVASVEKMELEPGDLITIRVDITDPQKLQLMAESMSNILSVSKYKDYHICLMVIPTSMEIEIGPGKKEEKNLLN